MTVTMNCIQCGKQFTTTNQHARGGRKYCSHQCYRTREKINPPIKRVVPVNLTCQTCGKGFQRDPGEHRAYVQKYGRSPLYCSTECGGIGRRTTNGRVCKNCSKPMPTYDSEYGRRRTVCSSECRSALKSKEMLKRRNENPPEPRPTRHGYMRVVHADSPDKKGREILVHRLNMERHLGRKLRPNETVHHKNGNRSFNDLSNLELFESRHGPGQRVADQIAWAIQLATDYPEFLREAGFELRKLNTPEDHSLLDPQGVSDVLVGILNELR